ncbi:hypothetical protein [Actinomadura rupiterrae]|uniref:hypothetical protein n=1 Tax=Actinomadura rupiterrae TaxID=559627 RepID=UPI0020A3CE9E|nr:hypothetical protein [Actinomadura rupiterrae]MCP2340188.1 uncharacterized membrane protein (DUF485 family) [Actinomadura rupiterrae]
MSNVGLVVALPALLVLIALNKKHKGKPKNKLAKAIIGIAILLMAFTVGCGFAYSFVGRWAAAAVSTAAGWISAGGGLAIGLTVVGILWATADVMYDRKADKGAQGWLIVLPTLLALVVGGQMGATGGHAVAVFFDQAHTLLTRMGGA